MIKIVSTIGRSWPAHGFHVKVGTNEYETVPAHMHGLLQGFLESGQMAMTPIPGTDTKAQEDAAAAALRIEDELAAKKAAEDAAAKAQAEADAKKVADDQATAARARREAKAAEDAAAKAQAEAAKTGKGGS